MSYSNYIKYKARYERGGCTIEQLQRLLTLGALTQEEYDDIVGISEEPESKPIEE